MKQQKYKNSSDQPLHGEKLASKTIASSKYGAL
jgi:hypothetical protein